MVVLHEEISRGSIFVFWLNYGGEVAAGQELFEPLL
jgi:hypothetical protein